MQADFKIGDLVRLKSGSPIMTINRLILKRNITSDMRGFTDDFEGEYECKWFDGTTEKKGYYMQDTLVAAE